MAKFAVKRKILLDFLGDDWKENNCYIEFTSFTIRDLQEKFPQISSSADDPKSVANGMTKTIDLLKEHFVSGKGMGLKNEVVDIDKEDMIDLPAEVINKIFSFLSEPLVKTEK